MRGLVLAGRVVTIDARLTQRAIAQTVLAGGGDAVMVVQGNPPRLAQDSTAVCDAPRPRRPARADR